MAEPVQVYLDAGDRERLERLRKRLDTTKSAVLRQALRALEQQLKDPSRHPALSVIGMAANDAGPAVGYDIAREHDRYLADLQETRSEKPTEAGTPRRRRAR